jgi:hypothetical protein
LATPLELVLGGRRFLRSGGSGDTSSSSETSRLAGREASTGIAAGWFAFPRYGDRLIQLAVSLCRELALLYDFSCLVALCKPIRLENKVVGVM